MCLAKTQTNRQCQRQSPPNRHFCHQHQKIYQKYLKSQKNRNKSQLGGGFGLLPSCLDILNCDWVTDKTSVIPLLNPVLNLLHV